MVPTSVRARCSTNYCTERKIASNTESSIKRREPGILKLAKTYNDICKEMHSLARKPKAPRNIVMPNPIDTHKLFSLDVDDDIWQDIGLDEIEDNEGTPLWLGDSNTRDGIKHLLILDRCLEEEARLKRERLALQEWMYEEWMTLQRALMSGGRSNPLYIISTTDGHPDVSEDMTYQLALRRKELRRLCARWMSTVQPMPTDGTDVEWGPSLMDLTASDDGTVDMPDAPADGLRQRNQSGDGDNGLQEDEDSEGDVSESPGEEDDLLDEAESVALMDIYRYSSDLGGFENS